MTTTEIVQVLLRADLIDDDTPDTRALAGRLADERDLALIASADEVQAVAEAIDRERLGRAGSDVVQQAAARVVAVLRGEGQ